MGRRIRRVSMHRIPTPYVIALTALGVFAVICVCFVCTTGTYEKLPVVQIEEDGGSDASGMPMEIIVIEGAADEAETRFSEGDIRLIALVTMAEAEGECEEGKRLVIDTILNRVDSECFPDTVYEVIYQPNQFSCIWDGRIERCEVREDICALVEEEMKERTNDNVIFFSNEGYSIFGEPMFQVEHHYFSSYGKERSGCR